MTVGIATGTAIGRPAYGALRKALRMDIWGGVAWVRTRPPKVVL